MSAHAGPRPLLHVTASVIVGVVPLFLGRRTGPRLQVLDLPAATEAHFAPASEVSLDSVIERDGWLVLTYNMQAWSLPCRAGSRPQLLTSGRHPTPHQDPALLWLNTNGFAVAVDSSGTPTGEEITLPDGGWLRSSIDGTHIFWDPTRGTSLLARPEEAVVDLPRMFLEHSYGSTALLSQVGGRRLYKLDLHRGSVDEIEVVGTGAWDNGLGVQSPDRTMVALTLELDPPPERRPETSIDEWIALCRTLPPRSPGRKLYILDLQTGTARLASTVIPTAFAPQLAWTADNAHIALKTHDTKTPSTRAVYGWMEAASLNLVLSPTTSRSASPYVDISNWYSD